MVTLLACATVSAARAQLVDDTTLAPADAWYTLGGCAARTGATRTALPAAPLSREWSFEAAGPIEGEPLVWGDLVVVAVRTGANQRTLTVLDLGTGHSLASKVFRTGMPLEPSLHGAIVLVRSAPDAIDAFRIDGDGLAPIWHHDDKAALSSPLLVGTDVYVVAGGVCLALSLLKPGDAASWRTASSIRGRLSVRGDAVYALDHSDPQAPRLLEFLRSTGAQRRSYYASPAPDRISADPVVGVVAPDAVVPAVFADEICLGVSSSDRAALPPHCRGLSVERELDRLDVTVVSPYEHWMNPAALPDGWIGCASDGKAAPSWMIVDQRHFATPGWISAPDLSSPGQLEPTTWGTVALIGASAYDTQEGRLLWSLDARPTRRTVPARDRVLVVEGESMLLAFRGAHPPAAGVLDLIPVVAAPVVQPHVRALRRDGIVVHGELMRDASGWKLAPGGKEAVLGPADVLLVVDDQGAVLWAADAGDVVRGLDVIEQSRVAQAYADLAEEARTIQESEVLGELLLEAEARRAPAVGLDKLRSAWLSLRGRARKSDAGKAAALRAKAAALSSDPASVPWRSFVAAGSDSERLRIALLTETLRRAPNHAEATAAVGALLPAGFGTAQPYPALDWLPAIADARRHGLSRVAEPATPATGTPGQVVLSREHVRWGSDVIAFESPRVVVLGKPGDDLALLRAAQLGELACTVLEEWFEDSPAHRTESSPLVIEVLHTAAEVSARYAVLESPARLGDARPVVYSNKAGAVLAYVPADPFEFASLQSSVLDVLAYQWMRDRCPAYTREERSRVDPRGPGYWVLDGLFRMVGSVVVDLETGTWQPPNASDRDRRLIAEAPPDKLIPWPVVFTQSWQDVSQLGDKAVELGASPTGEVRSVSASRLYGAQTNVASQFLWSRDGGHRRGPLIELAAAYFTGRSREVDGQALLGLSWSELGAATVAWARQSVAAP